MGSDVAFSGYVRKLAGSFSWGDGSSWGFPWFFLHHQYWPPCIAFLVVKKTVQLLNHNHKSICFHIIFRCFFSSPTNFIWHNAQCLNQKYIPDYPGWVWKQFINLFIDTHEIESLKLYFRVFSLGRTNSLHINLYLLYLYIFCNLYILLANICPSDCNYEWSLGPWVAKSSKLLSITDHCHLTCLHGLESKIRLM